MKPRRMGHPSVGGSPGEMQGFFPFASLRVRMTVVETLITLLLRVLTVLGEAIAGYYFFVEVGA